jgi:hypothetical protein
VSVDELLARAKTWAELQRERPLEPMHPYELVADLCEALRAAHADNESIDQMIDSYREDIETRDSVIRRFMDGWEPWWTNDCLTHWTNENLLSIDGTARVPATDAERAVLAAFDNEEDDDG